MSVIRSFLLSVIESAVSALKVGKERTQCEGHHVAPSSSKNKQTDLVEMSFVVLFSSSPFLPIPQLRAATNLDNQLTFILALHIPR